MRVHSWLPPLTAMLVVPGALGAVEQSPIMPEAVSAAPQFKGDGNALSVRSFGFSPFVEDGLVAEVPGAALHKSPQRVDPAYLTEFGATSD